MTSCNRLNLSPQIPRAVRFGLVYTGCLAAVGFVAACSGSVSEKKKGSSADDGDNGNQDGADDDDGGTTYEPPTSIVEAPKCTVRPGPQPLRRLSNREYELTVRDLFAGRNLPAFREALPGDNVRHHLDNNAAVQTVVMGRAEGYLNVAETLSESLTADIKDLTGCNATAPDDCLRNYLKGLAERSYRRPLLAGEGERVVATFEKLASETNLRTGLQAGIEQILQAPQFVYHTENLHPANAETNQKTLNAYELASRLSYFLWSTLPDGELLDAAKNNSLLKRDVLEQQTRRLLEHERGKAGLMHLAAQWLGYAGITEAIKSDSDFPDFTAAIAQAMKDETATFAQTIFTGDAPFSDLYKASYSFRSAKLQGFLDGQQASGDALDRVDLEEDRSAGILTQPSVLTLNATPSQSSPIYRGRLVREGLLCDELPLPAFAIPDVPEIEGDVTVREAHAQHANDPTCRPCHELVDPLGFGFENYDAVGRWRVDYSNGKPVDATGEILDAGLDETQFNGIRELGSKLASSTKAQRCAARQLLRFSLGRDETEAHDACAIDHVAYALRNGGDRSFRDVVIEWVTGPAFTTKPQSGEQ